eukprot:CAMPEP_0201893544 /NCGR_PEP_ID=MMETSP0902-20130614/38897_1 /ASSEMBLY_ACC=CAM_ASM_000551 /TAXON_ID=420261 /ORGANISM="Thalassiosira antarctica, Strain CCMP982" /LENGTH=211 /DNA_ID=CAMNT_0048425375 /DNA_START=52 /DNA_END=687 /DNA_ORIENTATION=-
MTTTRPVASSSSWLILSTLALLCTIAVVLRSNKQHAATTNKTTAQMITSRQTKQSILQQPSKGKSRNMVGGYSGMDTEFLQSEEILEIATFVLNQHAAGSSTFDSTSLAVLPEEVESGVIKMKVLEAQRQVVAGLNYRLTLAILKHNVCLGAFKVMVYKPLPYMEQDLTVTSWGNTLECSDIKDAMQAMEENALLVEEEMKEEQEEVEPDA